jgi:hypothetical protein
MKGLVHGVPDTDHMWTPLLGALGLAGGSYLAPMMPGFDGILPAASAATESACLRWLIEALEEIAGAYEPVDLADHD